jgi:hypothetical protein
MSPKFLRQPPLRAFPAGEFRSWPAEIGTAAPLDPVAPPRHLEFPQVMSVTAPDLIIPPLEPTNESPLAFGWQLDSTKKVGARGERDFPTLLPV